jgi:hypothetical protein
MLGTCRHFLQFKSVMESHEIPIYVTTPCYIVAVEGYMVDSKTREAVYDQNLQFVTQEAGTAGELAVVMFTDRRIAESYIAHMDEQIPLQALEIPNNAALKSFLRLATAVYRVASIDPDPETGTMRAGVLIEEILQNVDFPGVNVL